MADSFINPENLSKVNQLEVNKKTNKSIAAFDYLRAIFSIIVVAIHADFFILGEIFVASALTTMFRANVGYIAVPVFLQVSLFLFYSKSEKVGSEYFLTKRLPKLIYLYSFWLGLFLLFDVLFKGDVGVVKGGAWSLQKFLEILVSGGRSPFYFFFSLIFTTALTEVFIILIRKLNNPNLKTTISYGLLFLSCTFVFLLGVIVTINSAGTSQIGLIPLISSLGKWHYDPLNFLPYIFTTAITVQELHEGKLKKLTSSLKLKLYCLLALFLMFTILEWSLLNELVHYARISIVFGSWLLIYLALLSTRQPSTSIKFLSACSLGIYALHPFFTHILFPLNENVLLTLSQVMPGLDAIVKFVIALGGSIALTLIFKKVKGLRNFV